MQHDTRSKLPPIPQHGFDEATKIEHSLDPVVIFNHSLMDHPSIWMRTTEGLSLILCLGWMIKKQRDLLTFAQKYNDWKKEFFNTEEDIQKHEENFKETFKKLHQKYFGSSQEDKDSILKKIKAYGQNLFVYAVFVSLWFLLSKILPIQTSIGALNLLMAFSFPLLGLTSFLYFRKKFFEKIGENESLLELRNQHPLLFEHTRRIIFIEKFLIKKPETLNLKKEEHIADYSRADYFKRMIPSLILSLFASLVISLGTLAPLIELLEYTLHTAGIQNTGHIALGSLHMSMIGFVSIMVSACVVLGNVFHTARRNQDVFKQNYDLIKQAEAIKKQCEGMKKKKPLETDMTTFNKEETGDFEKTKSKLALILIVSFMTASSIVKNLMTQESEIAFAHLSFLNLIIAVSSIFLVLVANKMFKDYEEKKIKNELSEAFHIFEEYEHLRNQPHSEMVVCTKGEKSINKHPSYIDEFSIFHHDYREKKDKKPVEEDSDDDHESFKK